MELSLFFVKSVFNMGLLVDDEVVRVWHHPAPIHLMDMVLLRIGELGQLLVLHDQ